MIDATNMTNANDPHSLRSAPRSTFIYAAMNLRQLMAAALPVTMTLVNVAQASSSNHLAIDLMSVYDEIGNPRGDHLDMRVARGSHDNIIGLSRTFHNNVMGASGEGHESSSNSRIGTSRGLADDDIVGAPRLAHGPPDAHAHRRHSDCAICLQALPSAEGVVDGDERQQQHAALLQHCKHGDRFHRGCLERWLGTHNTCPMCRGPARGQVGIDGTEQMTTMVEWSAATQPLLDRMRSEYDGTNAVLGQQANGVMWTLGSTKFFLTRVVEAMARQYDYVRKSTSFLDSPSLIPLTYDEFLTRYRLSRRSALPWREGTIACWQKIQKLRERLGVYESYHDMARDVVNEAIEAVDAASAYSPRSLLRGMTSNYQVVARLRVIILERFLPAGDTILADAMKATSALIRVERAAAGTE